MLAQFSLGPTARHISEKLGGVWDMTTPALKRLGLEAEQHASEAHSLLPSDCQGPD